MRRRPLACATLALLAAGGCGREPKPDFSRVSAVESHLTLGKDGDALSVVELRSNPDVYYHVTLANAPLRANLELMCDWSDPGGRVVHQNHYWTQLIDKPVWPTYCHYRMTGAAAGHWMVRLSLAGRPLSTTSFEAR